MAQALITWTPGSSTGNQKIYYKLSGAGTYTLFATVAANVSTVTVTNLLENTIYDFKVENDCGTGDVGSDSDADIFITCPAVDLYPSSTTIDFSFLDTATATSVSSYTVDLLNASNVVIATKTIIAVPNTAHYDSFTGLTSNTVYKVRITVNAGSYSKTCTASTTSTIMTQGFFIQNVDYDSDHVNNGADNISRVLVGVYDNTASAWVVGDLNTGPFITGLGATQSALLSPIPTGDDFTISAGKRNGSVGFSIATEAWIQLKNASNTVLDINPSDPDNNEAPNNVNIAGFNIANGFSAQVKHAYGVNMPVAKNTVSGQQLEANIAGFYFVGSGAGKTYDVFNVTPNGSNYDVYVNPILPVNPFTHNPNNFLAGNTTNTPDNVVITGAGIGAADGMYRLGTNTFMFPEGTPYQGERIQSIPAQTLRLATNIGSSVRRDVQFGTLPQRNGPKINTVTRLGNILTINYTWNSYTGANSVVDNPESWDLYVTLILDGGTVNEKVVHVPFNATWNTANPTYQYTISPALTSINSITKTIPTLPSYTTLKARIYYCFSIVGNPTTQANFGSPSSSNLGADFSI